MFAGGGDVFAGGGDVFVEASASQLPSASPSARS